METIIGIDLGTTNSEVAIIRDGQPVVLEEDGDPILPSVVGLDTEGRLLVGKPARNQYALAPERTIRSIKRKMGQEITVALGDQKYSPRKSRRSSCGRSRTVPRRRWAIRSRRP